MGDSFNRCLIADDFLLQMACGGPLPKNGEEWHAIRQGRLPYLGRYSIELHSLLEQMIHPDPSQRPSTQTLTQHPVLGPNGAKSKDQLSRELTAERLKNRQLSEKLQGILQQLHPLSIIRLTESRSKLFHKDNLIFFDVIEDLKHSWLRSANRFCFSCRSCTSFTTFDADVEVCHRRRGAPLETTQTSGGCVVQSTATPRPQDESKSFQHGFLKFLSFSLPLSLSLFFFFKRKMGGKKMGNARTNKSENKKKSTHKFISYIIQSSFFSTFLKRFLKIITELKCWKRNTFTSWKKNKERKQKKKNKVPCALLWFALWWFAHR